MVFDVGSWNLAQANNMHFLEHYNDGFFVTRYMIWQYITQQIKLVSLFLWSTWNKWQVHHGRKLDFRRGRTSKGQETTAWGARELFATAGRKGCFSFWCVISFANSLMYALVSLATNFWGSRGRLQTSWQEDPPLEVKLLSAATGDTLLRLPRVQRSCQLGLLKAGIASNQVWFPLPKNYLYGLQTQRLISEALGVEISLMKLKNVFLKWIHLYIYTHSRSLWVYNSLYNIYQGLPFWSETRGSFSVAGDDWGRFEDTEASAAPLVGDARTQGGDLKDMFSVWNINDFDQVMAL